MDGPYNRRGFMVFDPSPLQQSNDASDDRFQRPRKPAVGTSAFSISPPKKKSANQQENIPTPIVELKQFQPKELLDFKDVELGKSKTLYLDIRNPSISDQSFQFFKFPAVEKGFTVDPSIPRMVPSGGVIRMPFTWTPSKETKVFESVLIQSNEGHRIQVSLVGTAFKKPEKVVRRGPNRRGVLGVPPPTSRLGIRKSMTYTRVPAPAQTEVKSRSSLAKSELPVIPPLDLAVIAEQDIIDQELETMRHKAATKIQAAWRGFITRKMVLMMIIERQKQERLIRCVKIIQRSWRGYAARKLLKKLIEDHQRKVAAATKIQSVWRGFLVRKMVMEMMIEKQKQEHLIHCVKIIQRNWRGYAARKLFVQMKEEHNMMTSAATKIQVAWRGYAARKLFKKLMEDHHRRIAAATKIQSAWRAFLARKIVLEMMIEKLKQEHLIHCVEVIQRNWRGYAARKLYKKLIEEQRRRVAAATKIQSVWRGFLARKMVLEMIEKKKQEHLVHCVRVIQRNWRSHHFRSQLEDMIYQRRKRIESATKIQAAWRGYTARQELLRLRLQHRAKIEERAAMKIQALWRGCLARRVVREIILQRNKQIQAATKIQAFWRGYVDRKLFARMVQEHQMMITAATKIQVAWRGYSARKLLKKLIEEHQRRVAAATKIQSVWRGFLARKMVMEMIIEKQKQEHLIHCAKIIQRNWRGYAARKLFVQMKEEHNMMTSAATKIQVAWRGYAARKLFKRLIENHQRRVAAATKIQAAWRGYVVRQELLKWWLEERAKFEKAATKIQAAWRGYRTRKIVFEQNKEIELLNIKVNEKIRNSDASQQIGNRTSMALDALLNYTRLDQIAEHLRELSRTTQLSPESCETICSQAALEALLNNVIRNNRSEPAKRCFIYTLEILVNLARYHKTAVTLALNSQIIEICVFYTRVFKSSEEAVTKLFILLWILICRHGAQVKGDITIKSLVVLLKDLKAGWGRQSAGVKNSLLHKRDIQFSPYWASFGEPATFSDRFHAFAQFSRLVRTKHQQRIPWTKECLQHVI